MTALAEVQQECAREAELYEKLGEGRVRCFACGHRCPIPEGASGVCKVRFNRGGTLMAPYGYVAGMQADPVEKKPFFHVRPGATALSFGMLGCNLHCGYCQNWITSQALRDPEAISPAYRMSPEDLVRRAIQSGSEIIVSTYNEPLITSEWAVSIFRLARNAGLLTGFVSNGNGTPEVIRYLLPWVDLYKVDLKSFDDQRYRKLGGRLGPILDTIHSLHRDGVWVEIVTLLVPGFNDSQEELRRLTEFIAGVSPDIPWHVTAYHRDYKMTEPRDTGASDLMRALEIGHRSGLRFVYAGNLPGQLKVGENTLCTRCGQLLVERRGYRVITYAITVDGRCPQCSLKIPGRWRTG
jgi:pyruvate formate lyase activating enzyme